AGRNQEPGEQDVARRGCLERGADLGQVDVAKQTEKRDRSNRNDRKAHCEGNSIPADLRIDRSCHGAHRVLHPHPVMSSPSLIDSLPQPPISLQQKCYNAGWRTPVPPARAVVDERPAERRTDDRWRGGIVTRLRHETAILAPCDSCQGPGISTTADRARR